MWIGTFLHGVNKRCTWTEMKHVARGSNSTQWFAKRAKSSCVMTSRSFADAASKPSKMTPMNRFINTYVIVSVKLEGVFVCAGDTGVKGRGVRD